MIQRCRYNQKRLTAFGILVLLPLLYYTRTIDSFYLPVNRYHRSDDFKNTHHHFGGLEVTTYLQSTKNSPNLVDFIDSIAAIWSKSNEKQNDKALQNNQRERKNFLLSLVQKAPNDSSLKVVTLSDEINQAIDSLAELSPITSTDELSRQLNRKWNLVWTTEKEINLFLDKGWSNDITQEISSSDSTIINTIPFVNDNGYFGVTGRIFRTSDDPIIRTQFVFETATLQLNQFSWLPTLTFPPVGKGWFDTVYLDDNFRVDRNSRNDILICQSSEWVTVRH